MKKMKKFFSLVLILALIISFLPEKKAEAAELPASLTAATNTTATVTWNIAKAQEEVAYYGGTLIGFQLSYWSLEQNQDVLVTTVAPTVSTYTFRNMNPSWNYLLFVDAIARRSDGSQYTAAGATIDYVPSKYGSGSGTGGNVTPGGGSTDPVGILRSTVANTAITEVGYYQSGFGKSKGLSVKWKGYSDITGYQANLYNRKGKLVESRTIPNAYMNYCTFSKANTKNVYFVKVRMYYTYGGVTTWSKWSANFNAVPQAKIKAKKKDIKRHAIKLRWQKVSGATKYTVYARKGGTKKWTKVKTLKAKSSSYSFTKFKKKKITVNASGYDLKVMTTGKVNGKKVNSTSYYYTNYYLI